MRYGILGGGFGMYGYLPAIVASQPEAIVTLARYREIIRNRRELCRYEGHLTFVETREQLLESCDRLVVAQRPVDQEQAVADLLATRWRGRLILEKPLARTPAAGLAMVERLQAADLRFVIGFSVAETPWAKRLLELLAGTEPSDVRICWRFFAHHYRQDLPTWKRRVSEGGGALGFYAIHLLALLAQTGTWTVEAGSPFAATDEDPRFDARLRMGGRAAAIECDTAFDGPEVFEVKVCQEDRVIFEYREPGPFSSDTHEKDVDRDQDARCEFLRPILQRVEAGLLPEPRSYAAHLELWSELQRHRRERSAAASPDRSATTT